MNGIIVVNKQSGMTSHDVVGLIRRIFKTKQVGHLGTLDPLACGVLAVCLNDATKLAPYLENVEKEYDVEVLLGKSSDTFDIEGKITSQKTFEMPSLSMLDLALASFLGKNLQTPPIFSAIKVKGKKLYEYARKNQEVEIPKREIEVFKITRTSDIYMRDNEYYFTFSCLVSKGTYIRSIVNDLGQKLNVPCLMSQLKRTKNGVFTLNDASTIEEIEKGDFKLITLIDALKFIPSIESDDFIKKATNGMKISPNEVKKVLGFLPPIVKIVEKDILHAVYLFDEKLYAYKAGRVWKY